MPAGQRKLIARKDELNLPEFGGPWFCPTMQPGVITVNVTRTSGNACDNRDYSHAECKLREDCFRMAAILKENVDEFKDSFLMSVSTQAGVRETRRIQGVHVLTGEEYLNATRFEDSISRGAHPIDIHVANGENKYNLPEAAGLCTIQVIDSSGFSEPDCGREMHKRRQDSICFHQSPVKLHGHGTVSGSRCGPMCGSRKECTGCRHFSIDITPS